MGKKKRKCASSQMPPLMFMNSPTYQPSLALSPDLAAENPLTAKSVPVDELDAWVSPQFEKTECYNLRRTRRQQRSNTTRLRDNCTSDNLRHAKSKFVPLAFVHQNVSIDSDEEQSWNCDEKGKYNIKQKSHSEMKKKLDNHLQSERHKGSEEESNSFDYNVDIIDAADQRTSVIDRLCAGFMCGQTPPRCSQPDVVLAVDTPEHEYGLSHRQKELRHIRYGLRSKDKSAITKCLVDAYSEQGTSEASVD